MIFVDTNYFLRLLLRDVEKQHRQAKRLFEDGALGKIKLFTSIVVFFEIYWVLSSFYGKKKSKVVKILIDILKMDFIKFEKKEVLRKAVEIFAETTLDLEDSFSLAYAHKMKATEFATFDQKLIREFSLQKRKK